MTEVFFRILEISITAGIVALIVMVFRFIFKGAPRWVSCLLWAIVALRLLCPFAIESRFSLMPDMSDFSESYVSQTEGVPAVAPVPQSVVTHTKNTSAQETEQEESSFVDVGRILAVVWLCGMGGMLVYGGVSYLLTRRKVSDSVPYKDNIRQSEKIKSPFILGMLRPYIYIPFALDKQTQKYVLAHEQAHLKRLDHIWKPLGFILLCVHWFNPLMWVSYILLCRDVEVACDEKVIREFDLKKRKAYATALLDCKVSQGVPAACPLAFGEVGVGQRIKKTLRYKKPATVIAVVALVMIMSVSVCLLTDPVSGADVQYYVSSGERVTEGYEKPTEPPATEPPTEPATEPPETEAPAETQVYEDYYTDYNDYSDDYSDYEQEEKYPTIMVERPPLPNYVIVWNSTHTSWSMVDLNSLPDDSDESENGVSQGPSDDIVSSHFTNGGINMTTSNKEFPTFDSRYDDLLSEDEDESVTSEWVVP